MAVISQGSPSPSESSCGQSAQGKTSQHTSIEMLPEDTLLVVFDIYRLDTMIWSRDGHQWDWLHLAHVCRRWRDAISISPHRLGLWILCSSGAPIERILGSWSTVPLIVRFKGGPNLKSLHDNITAALRHPDRICEIDLDVTSSMAAPIVEAIQEPFLALKSIRITVRDATWPPILVRNAFLGGSSPDLREIKLDGIAFPFPAIRQALLSNNNLVELHLSGIPHDVYFPADDLVTALSSLIQLDRLTIGFHSPSRLPPRITHSHPPQCTTLPSLTFLEFHGASEYLEEIVSRLDFPALGKITIRLFNQIFFEIPQFRRSILRLKALGSPTWVFVTHSAKSVSVVFVQQGKPSNENCFLGTSCKRLDWQLSFVTQISNQLSPLLSNVHSLSIKAGHHKLPTGEEDMDPAQWLELFRPFTHLTEVYVWEKQLVPGIVQALVMEDMAAGVLPGMTSLHLSGYRSSPSVAEAAERFIATRSLAGHAVRLIG